MKNKKLKPYLVGLFQAFGISAYCALVILFFQVMENSGIETNQMVAGILMLIILVFSAAISALIVFGRSVYLTINKRIKEAMYILAFTFLYLIAIIMIIVLLLCLS